MQDEVYIVGGGSSLRTFNFSRLESLNTIAVNMAGLDVPKPNIVITADSGMFRKIQEGLLSKVKTTKVVVANPDHCAMKFVNGQYVHVKSGFVYNPFCVDLLIKSAGVEGIGFSFSDFRTGYNSGFCAFQLAVLLRFKKIYLLGFDLNKGVSRQHYHNRYGSKPTIDDASMGKFYRVFVDALRVVKEKTDIKVFSCSPTSRLNDVIPYSPFEEINLQRKLPIDSLRKKQERTLSILICSIAERKAQLRNLHQLLKVQKVPGVQILTEIDNRKITIGEKRNRLLKQATNDYIVFVDDDDVVAPNYVSKILAAIQKSPDCCGIEGQIFFRQGNVKRTFLHSIQYSGWFQAGRIYYRCPNHLNPVRRDLALKVMFPDISKGEDKDYSLRLREHLKSEIMIPGCIYYYNTG